MSEISMDTTSVFEIGFKANNKIRTERLRSEPDRTISGQI